MSEPTQSTPDHDPDPTEWVQRAVVALLCFEPDLERANLIQILSMWKHADRLSRDDAAEVDRRVRQHLQHQIPALPPRTAAHRRAVEQRHQAEHPVCPRCQEPLDPVSGAHELAPTGNHPCAPELFHCNPDGGE